MIGTAAFKGCTKVTSVTISNSVTEICPSAFNGCTGLTSITIPKKCNEIDESAFDGCANITSIVWNVESMRSWYGTKIFDNINRNIKTFTFGKDVYRIPKGLCNGMSGITSITIPENVYFIEAGTFYGCTSLTSIVWNAKEIYDMEWDCRNQAPFCGIVDSITSFVFGDKVRDIPPYLCEGMTKITSIVIPDNVCDIGRSAFGYCRGLTSVTISNNVRYIPQDAFESCKSLTSVNIPNSVTKIGGGAFWACYALASVTIGNKVTSIGNSAFGSTSITSIIIPNSVTSIGSGAFNSCEHLTSIIIPNSVTSIGSSTFWDCTSLTSITIPNSVTSIGESAFQYCGGLTSVTIGNSVTSIGECAFYNTGLTSISIPESVTSIGDMAFTGIKQIRVFATNPPDITKYSFYTPYKIKKVYVPTEAADLYKNHSIWGKKDEFDIISPIPYYVLLNCDNTQGSVSGDGSFLMNDRITIKATPKYRYHFVRWSDGNTDNPRTIIVTQDTTLTAEFAPNQYTITTYAQHGSVNGGGTYDYGTTATLTATADAHYHFTQWSDGNTDNPRTVSVEGDATYTAEFKPDSYTIIVSAGEHGNVNGGGTYDYGTTAILTATADEHYHFSQWNDGNTDNPRTVSIEGDATYTAEFKPNSYTITVSTDGHGSANGGGTYDYGTTATLTATAVEHYHFARWNDGNTDNPRTVTVEDNATYTAEFKPDSYTIIVSAGEHGSANGGGTYDYGTTATLTATADEHYHFTQWSDGNTDNPRTVSVEGDATYTAEFAIDQHTVTATCDPQRGTVTGTGTYDYGTQVTLTATANKGYEFAQWSNGVTDNPYLLTATEDLTLEAQFIPATAVENISADGDTAVRKVFRDGQVYILRNGKTYTTTGIEVK